jgi:hypothetical protein
MSDLFGFLNDETQGGGGAAAGGGAAGPGAKGNTGNTAHNTLGLAGKR